MSNFVKGYLKLLNALAIFFALSPFRFNKKRKCFTKSWTLIRFITMQHYLVTLPIGCWIISIFYILDLSQPMDHKNMQMHCGIWPMACLTTTMVIMGFRIIRSTNEFRIMLNTFVLLVVQYERIFKHTIKINWLQCLAFLVRDVIANHLLLFLLLGQHLNLGGGIILRTVVKYHTLRMLLLTYFFDLAMLFLTTFYKSLSKLLSSQFVTCDERITNTDLDWNLYLAYYKNLLKLRYLIEKYSTPILVQKILSEISNYTFKFYSAMWLGSHNKAHDIVAYIIVAYVSSNILCLSRMALKVDYYEQKILNTMFIYQYHRALRKGDVIKNVYINSLERNFIERGFSNRRTVNFTNFIFKRRTLILELAIYCLSTILLMASFHLKYD